MDELITRVKIYNLQFENFDQIQTYFKLVPDTVKVTTRIDPIVLDLH